MKKLLSTTAIIGAVAFATSANAADLQVNVGGFLDFQAGYTSDDAINKGADQRNKINFGNDTEVHFSVDGKADNGLEYGAVVELEADIADNTTADDSANGFNADKTYLFLQGGFGRIEMGGNTGAEEALSVNTSTFASATGGVDGDFYRYVDSVAAGTGFIAAPDLRLTDNGDSATANEDATKITYYTPRFAGFQAGVSYIPNTEDTGNANANTAALTGQFENVWTGGVNYSGEFSGVGIKAAATGIAGKNSEKVAGSTADLEGWDVGANLGFSGITVGGSYGNWGETFGVNTDADYWDAGLGYEAGAFSASATYLKSSVESAAGAEDKFDNIVLGADYKLAPGLVPYAEVAFFDYDGSGGAVKGTNDNSGTVVILGTELSF